MIRFWTFVVGLALIVLAAHNMAAGGIDLTEFRVLLTLVGLLALAQVVEVVGGWIEQSYADRRDLREAMAESDRTEVEVDGGAVLHEQAAPVHVLERRWTDRHAPDGGNHPDDSKADQYMALDPEFLAKAQREASAAEKIRAERERGEQA